MTKKEIVRIVAEQTNLPQQKIKEVVQATFDTIVDVLVKEERLELRNFGIFSVKKRAARSARNPKTGEKILVDEHRTIIFKPGKEMDEKIRKQ